jgi:hypothetical protein
VHDTATANHGGFFSPLGAHGRGKGERGGWERRGKIEGMLMWVLLHFFFLFLTNTYIHVGYTVFGTLSATSMPYHVSRNHRSNHLEILFALVLRIEGRVMSRITIHG